MDQNPQEKAEAVEISEDYPLGGSLEPYDIWHEMQILENYRHTLCQRK